MDNIIVDKAKEALRDPYRLLKNLEFNYCQVDMIL